MRNYNSLITVFSFFLGLMTSTAQAVPVTLYYSWYVISVDDQQNFLNGAIPVADVLSGSMTYENTTPDSNSNSKQGTYENPLLAANIGNALIDFQLDANLHLPNSTQTSVFHIADNTDWTHFDWDVAALPSTGFYASFGAASDLVHLPNDAITGLDIGPGRSDTSYATINIYSDSSLLQPVATVNLGQRFSYSLTPVPVPATAWLLGSGLIGLVGIRRRPSNTMY